MKSYLAFPATMLLVLFGAAACSSSDGPTPPPPPARRADTTENSTRQTPAPPANTTERAQPEEQPRFAQNQPEITPSREAPAARPAPAAPAVPFAVAPTATRTTPVQPQQAPAPQATAPEQVVQQQPPNTLQAQANQNVIPPRAETVPRPQAETQRPTFVMPTTRISRLFNRLMDDANNLDEVERTSGALVAEIFADGDQIRPKIWEVQTLVRERADQNRYSPEQSDKVRTLEAGLALAAKNREYYTIGEDAAIILGSSLALAVLRGYHVTPPTLTGVRDTVSGGLTWAGERISNGANAVKEGAARVWSWRPWQRYQEAGPRVEQQFARMAAQVTPKDRLMRELSALDLEPEQLAYLQTKIMPQEAVDPAALERFRFQRTNAENISIAPVRYDPRRIDEDFGYFVFHQRVKRLGRRDVHYYWKTENLPEDRMQTLGSKMYYGQDRRVFADFIPEGEETVSRGRAAVDAVRDRMSTWRERAASGARSVREKIVDRFDMPRAAQTMAVSTALLGTGYAFGRADDDALPDVYLESLLELPQRRQLPPIGADRPLAMDIR